MKTAREGTFAWRLMWEREKLGLSQVELSEELVRRLRGKKIAPPTPVTVSKMERGIIVTPKHEVLEELAKIFGVTTDYLITGRQPEPEPDQFNTPEANSIGAMVDQMSQPARKFIEQMAKDLLALDKDQHSRQMRIARLLLDNINALDNGDRATAHAYIADTDRQSIDLQ